MKHMLYGFAGIIALGTATPAFANSAPAMHAQPATFGETTTRTVVVGETRLYGQQIVAALDSVDKASTFRELMRENGISGTLRSNSSGYTAFVPVNRSFEGMALPASAGHGKYNPQLRALLEDHVVDYKYDINLLRGTRDFVDSISGKRITVAKAGRGYYVNGHAIVDRHHTPEGIIYFIEGVIDAPVTARSAVYNPADARK